MNATRERRGLIIFGLIAVIIVIVALAAYQMTGQMGIEDRYNQAVGLPVSGEEGGDTLFGFSVEGNPVRYLVVLGVLVLACFVAYRLFMAKPE